MAWVYPVSAPIGRPYNYAWSGYESGHHTGQDFTAGAGTKVGAASGGTVIYAGDTGGPYGKQIIIDHGNGIYTQYAHLSVVGVKVGDRVKPGMGIGAVGSSGTNSSGPHLHFEVRRNGSSYGDDINPIKFLENHDADRNGVTGDFGGVSAQGDRTGKGDGGRSDDNGGPSMSKADYGFDKEFLKKHPEIARLVENAVDKELSIAQFQARLKETKWWENHTAAQREWQIGLAEDPATAAETLKDYEQQIRTMAQTLGVDLSKKEIGDLAEKAARNAWDSTEIQMVVGRQFTLGKPGSAQTGQASTVTQDLEGMADAYAVPMSRHQKAKWTTAILQGKQTVESYNDILREKAKNLYPHLADAIDRAGSVTAWADSYLQQAANLTGVSPDQMRLDRGKYAQLMQPTKDGKPPTMAQWETLVRTDERFGYDKGDVAQQEASTLATQIAGRMGAI